MVMGKPAPVVNEKYAILKKAMRLGLDAAKTGLRGRADLSGH